MNRQELNDILIQVLVDGQPIEVWYDHFVATPQKPTIAPPFILYHSNSTDTFKADGIVWDKDINYIVELCVDKIDESLETQIENLFDTNEIIYEKDENFLESERMYQITYYI